MLELLEPGPREQVREALSQVQMLYAREAKGGGRRRARPAQPAPNRAARASPEAERPSGLWTPPGTSIRSGSLQYPRLAAGPSPAASD